MKNTLKTTALILLTATPLIASSAEPTGKADAPVREESRRDIPCKLITPTGIILSEDEQKLLDTLVFTRQITKPFISDTSITILRGGLNPHDHEVLFEVLFELFFITTRTCDELLLALILHTNDNFINATRYGKSPLHFAVRETMAIPIIRMLLKANANVNAPDLIGHTPLHTLIITKFFSNDPSISTAWNAVLQLLLDAGANINAQDNDGNTPLHTAARLAFPRYESAHEIITLLLASSTINANIKNNREQLPSDCANEDIRIKNLIETHLGLPLSPHMPSLAWIAADYDSF